MAKVKKLEAPIGWLIDPHKKWAINFDFKKANNDHNSADFTIDTWGVVPKGKPMKFKSRRKVTKQDSEKTWQKLIEANWVEFNCDKNMTA